MGKSPIVYQGNERSRYHSYSRNNQSRNRRLESQGFGPDNYIYPPDPYLRQLQPRRRGNKHVGRGSSQQYFRERTFRNRPLSSNRGRSLLVQQNLTPQRRRLTRNMHPPEELEAVSNVSEQSKNVTKAENDSTSKIQILQEDQSNGTSQTSVPQTRSNTKLQQNKSEETSPTKKCVVEDTKGQSQNLQTKSTGKARSKSEEPEKECGDSKITRNTRGNSSKSLQSKSSDLSAKVLSEVDDITAEDQASSSQARSAIKVLDKVEEPSILTHKVVDSVMFIPDTRENNKSVNDDEACGTALKVQLVEEETGSHNTRSAAKTKQEANDKTEPKEETEPLSKPRKLRNEPKTVTVDMSVDTRINLEQDSEIVSLAETDQTLQHQSVSPDKQLNKEVAVSVSQETEPSGVGTGHAQENEASVEKQFTCVSPDTEKLMGDKSPKLILSHVDTPMKKLNDLNPEKTETKTLTGITDVPKLSSRRSISKMKTEESPVLYKRQHRAHSRTPVQIQPEKYHKDHYDTSVASIRSISCRRPIRDSPISIAYDNFRKQTPLITRQVQLTVEKNSECLSGSQLDVSAEDNKDMDTASDDSSAARKKIRKRKSSTLETPHEHKKICTLKPAQTSFFPAVSSPLQITMKQELVSSSTPVKVVECFETVHMQVSEENISEESLEYEKSGDISDQSMVLESETHLIKENIVDESLGCGKTGDISGQSVTLENEAHLIEPEQTTRKWCSVM